MDSFLTLGLPKPLLQSLEKMNFSTPTPIQAAAIPAALQGKDILGSAQTGTGKTAAFGVPLLNHLMNNPTAMAIVLTPTRELAAQVLKAVEQMMPQQAMIKGALLIGGDSMFKQLQRLKQRPRLIVGTPGRINDHLQQRTLNLSAASFLVLDETDKMLDMGFEVQIDRIVKNLPQKRQTLLFSATLPPFIVKLANKYTVDPVRVAVGSTQLAAPKIKQEVIQVLHPAKYNVLLEQLQKREGSVILFVKTKHGADRIAKKLNGDKMSADAIHGDLRQNQRTRVIDQFRNKKYRILVATDVAARGLDIPHIEHVINYDLPQVAEDYIHRIGRTARAGAEGSAVCFVSPEDRQKWVEIQRLMNPNEKQSEERPRPAMKQGGGKKSFGKKNEDNAGGFQQRASRHKKRRIFKEDGGGYQGRPEGRSENRNEGRSENRGPRRDNNAPRRENDGPRRENNGGQRRDHGQNRDGQRRSEGGPKRGAGGNHQNRPRKFAA